MGNKKAEKPGVKEMRIVLKYWINPKQLTVIERNTSLERSEMTVHLNANICMECKNQEDLGQSCLLTSLIRLSIIIINVIKCVLCCYVIGDEIRFNLLKCNIKCVLYV